MGNNDSAIAEYHGFQERLEEILAFSCKGYKMILLVACFLVLPISAILWGAIKGLREDLFIEEYDILE